MALKAGSRRKLRLVVSVTAGTLVVLALFRRRPLLGAAHDGSPLETTLVQDGPPITEPIDSGPSTEARRRLRRELALLTGIPVATFLFVFAVTSMFGVAVAPNCRSAENFFTNLLFQRSLPSTCTSVPFLADMPTVILSFTSPFAVASYWVLRSRLAHLTEALKRTGLLVADSLQGGFSAAIRRLERSVDLSFPIRTALAIFVTGLTVWLYWQNLEHGHLFDSLAASGPGGTTSAVLRDGWWANYKNNVVLGVICVAGGAVGVYYALRAAWLYFRLGLMLIATRKLSPEALPIKYVPKWRDKSYGWSPVNGVLTLLYFSTVNFTISMVSIFDMLRNQTWTFNVALGVAVFGTTANGTIIVSAILRIRSAHAAVRARLYAAVARATSSDHLTSMIDTRNVNAADVLVAVSDLGSWRRFPVGSSRAELIKLLPAAYAVFQFIRVFS